MSLEDVYGKQACEIKRLTAELERYRQGVEVGGYLEEERLSVSIGTAQSLVDDFGVGQRVRVLVMKEGGDE